jgi:acyl-coenzyme A thioesterase PaaI-like protein
MEGEFLEFDLQAGSLAARFPVSERSLNPFGTMQGGMIAAAVDNTLGPLSMLVAPPSVTRRFEITYSRPVPLAMGHILVQARLVERQERKLFFRADVRGPEGERLARAKATHWIVKDDQTG